MSQLIGKELLLVPFPANEVSWRAGSTNGDKTKALALAYIDARAVMRRLDEAVGAENWQDRYRELGGRVICTLSIHCKDTWVEKEDGSLSTDLETSEIKTEALKDTAVKADLSDAFKRAAVKWGIGRYLYELPPIWVACEERGRAVYLKEVPTLPAWALPGGSGYPPSIQGPGAPPEKNPSSFSRPPSPASAPEPKKGEEKTQGGVGQKSPEFFRFLKSCEEKKKHCGETRYYRILATFGLAKSNQVADDPQVMKNIFLQLAQEEKIESLPSPPDEWMNIQLKWFSENFSRLERGAEFEHTLNTAMEKIFGDTGEASEENCQGVIRLIARQWFGLKL